VVPDSVEVLTLMPEKLLGSPTESIYWKRENAERWIHRGQSDAQSLLPKLRDWQAARYIS